jgi:hypothetical protein
MLKGNLYNSNTRVGRFILPWTHKYIIKVKKYDVFLIVKYCNN